MKAAIVHEVGGRFEVEEVAIDSPRAFEVLIDVKASGLCHSDLYIAERGLGVPMPVVLGHEIAGVVRQVGDSVTEFAVGDHVVACLVRTCGRCERCRLGRPYECLNPGAIFRDHGETARVTHNGSPVEQFYGLGGFAEQALVHENQLVKVPTEIPFDKACLLGCGVVTGAGTVLNTAGVRVGDTVAVFGCGGVGLNAVQAARLAGARLVIAVDLQPEKLELALAFGATHTVNPADGDAVEQIRSLTAGRGVDHAFEVIGLKVTALQALGSLGTGGTMYLIGLQKPGDPAEIDFDVDLMVGQHAIRGVHMGSTNPKRDIPLYADLYLQGRFNLDDLVSSHITLDGINEAYEELKTGKAARSVVMFE